MLRGFLTFLLFVVPLALAEGPVAASRVGVAIPPVAFLRVVSPSPGTPTFAEALELSSGRHVLRAVANTRWSLSLSVRGKVLVDGVPYGEGRHVLEGRGRREVVLEVEEGGRVEVGVGLGF